MAEEDNAAPKSRLPALKPKPRGNPFKLVDLGEGPTSGDLAAQAAADPSAARKPEGGEGVAPGESAAAVPSPGREPPVAPPPGGASERRTAPGPEKRSGRSKSEADAQILRIQVALPFETFMSFKDMCSRKRNSMQAELKELVEQALRRKS